jgi:hypothetical protein
MAMGIKGTADKGISNSVVQYLLHVCVYMHRMPCALPTFYLSAIIRSIIEPLYVPLYLHR